MKISTFTIIKNEIDFIAHNILSVIDYVDEMVFADGNSVDGTVEVIKCLQDKYGKKIKLYENKDCPDLKQGYTDLFNWTIGKCSGEYIQFLHPDMITLNPKAYLNIKDALAYYVNVRSFAGDKTTEITRGRQDWWKIIHKNDFGLHYYGFYGAQDEDLYFRDITGDEHIIYPEKDMYPYELEDSGLNVNHYCEAKTYPKRLQKMKKCLRTQYPWMKNKQVDKLAKQHPRVTLKTGAGVFGEFIFEKGGELPPIFKEEGELWKKINKIKNKIKNTTSAMV